MKTTFQYFLLPNLGLESQNRRNLHNWIQENRFSSVNNVDSVWYLEAYSTDELYAAFAPDFERFSFSSFETFSLAGLEVEKCNSTSWPLLKLYYSAFFAAHALTRATGHGHVNLNSKATNAVNAYISLMGGTSLLKAGSYKVSVKEENSRVYLVLKPSNEGSGVHDSFWRYFCSYLDDLANYAVGDALPSASSFLRETNALKSCINDNGVSGVWFSATRNAINYRHEFDCWLPNGKKSQTRKLVFPRLLGDPDSMEPLLTERNSELVRLVQLSTYLASLNYHVILMVRNVAGGNASFSRKWKRLRDFVG